MDGGKKKKAKEYFSKSLIDPNGNVLAQVEWASAKAGLQFVTAQRLASTFDADEATAMHFIREKKLEAVVEACKRWSDAEPYSLRPWELGGINASLIGDFKSALDFANGGIRIRGNVDMLLNTKAFSLACLGDLEAAARVLAEISDTTGHQYLVSEANRGLVEMRQGHLEAGLTHYKTAVEGFRKTQQAEAQISAQIYMFREAARAGQKDLEPHLKELRHLVERYGYTQYSHIIDEAENLHNARNLFPELIVPVIKASIEVLNWPPQGGNLPILLK